MPSNHSYDSQESAQLYLPYAPNLSKLAGEPVLYDGSNMYCTWGGTQKKRPPMVTIGPTTQLTTRCDRLWIYETLDATPNVYIVGSFYSSGVWILRWFDANAVTPTWTTVTERRACNNSTLPHEGIVRRGKLFIKSFPMNAGTIGGTNWDTLGSIILDGTGGNGIITHDWGAIGPTDPAALTNPAGWTASSGSVTVLNSWLYAYTWVMQSGNETNRSPLETNPDKSPSGTGAFTNKIPAMAVVGPTDTTEYPYINIYRTTDGGGTFFLLKQIVNLGGTQTFTDTYLESGASGGTFTNPTPDTQLNTTAVAPTTTSNGPPPTVAPPFTTGSDPIAPCTRIVEYAGRLWLGIGEYLFFSALEELNSGVPEECWPAGDQLPNFYRMPKGISQLEVTPSGLLVTTRTETIRVEGTNRASFNPRPFLGGVGGAALQNRGSIEAGDYAAWVTQDFRVVVIHRDSYAVLSNEIGSVIEGFADAGMNIDIKFWAHGDKEWLLVAAHDPVTPANSRWLIYDMNLSRKLSGTNFWFVPWVVQSSAIAVGQYHVMDSENRILTALWDGTYCRLTYMYLDATDYEDLNPATGAGSAYGWTLTTSLQTVPEGDHVNKLRAPNMSPCFTSVQVERTVVAGDADPSVSLYYDDFFSLPVPLPISDPPARRPQSTGYTTLTYNGGVRTCKHVALLLTGDATSTVGAEILQLAFNWLPESGA